MKMLRSFTLGMASLAMLGTLNVGMIAYAQTAPDNSAQNKNQPTTADKQSNAKSDRMMTAQIRKAIIADKGLSTYAHNVKIVVANGSVLSPARSGPTTRSRRSRPMLPRSSPPAILPINLP
jgi:hyperosmotically inducible protein